MIDTLRTIVDTHSYQRVFQDELPAAEYVDYETNGNREDFDPEAGLLVDVQTAKAMLLVHDALKERNQQKFAELAETANGFVQLAEFAWEQVVMTSNASGFARTPAGVEL